MYGNSGFVDNGQNFCWLEEAEIWVNTLDTGGTGWRMPTPDELNTLIHGSWPDLKTTPLLDLPMFVFCLGDCVVDVLRREWGPSNEFEKGALAVRSSKK